MASKVPKFGAWEGKGQGQGGENFTVFFDNARKTKNNGQKINPNDPEENPELFRQNGAPAQAAAPSQGRADQPRKQTKVPHFGAWENGESAGYTVCFENARKNKNGGVSTADQNEPQMNRDMPHRAHVQPQSRPTTAKPETKEANVRPKVPQFGDWEGEGGGGYTAVFDNLKKKNDVAPAPQMNRDVAPAPQETRGKVPQFGAWEGGEGIQYTAYFDNAKKTKNSRPGLIPTEPQLNRDVGEKVRPPPGTKARPESREDYGLRNASRTSASSTGSDQPAARQGKQPSASQSPLHPKGKLQPKTGGTGSRGNQAASIPQFGGWNNDPSQAEGYTTAFARAKEEKNTPQHNNAHPSYQQQNRYNDQKQPSCCSIM